MDTKKYIISTLILVMLNEIAGNEIEVRFQYFEETQRPIPPRIMQDMYMKPVIDDLPPIEKIYNCHCPRIYIPVCGSDKRSYTNICKMNCANIKRRPRNKWAKVVHMGICTEFVELVLQRDEIEALAAPYREHQADLYNKLPANTYKYNYDNEFNFMFTTPKIDTLLKPFLKGELKN